MGLRRHLLLLLVLLLCLGGASSLHAQDDSLNYRVFSTAQGAISGQTPFWHYANTWGLRRPGTTSNWLSGAAVERPFQNSTGLDYSLGAEAVGRVSDASNTAHLLQLYGKLQYRGLRLSVGRFQETVGGTQDPLSMGSMIVSRNAPPVPKIKISTPSFLDVPYTSGYLQVRGRWSDGRLEGGRAVRPPILHQKSLYLKANITSVEVTGGFVQNTIWGGGNKAPTFEDYAKVFYGSLEGSENDENRVGNSVAAYDVGVQYTRDDWQIRAYRLFYLEDTVSMRLRSPWDGMWGLGLRRTDDRGWITGVLYEHMNTIQQDALPGAPRGRAGYYDHYISVDGAPGNVHRWTYEGTVLGNPLLVYDSEKGKVVNNMILAHHLGLEGAPTDRFSYEARFTYSRNYGICEDQIIEGTCRIVSYRPPPDDQEVRPRSTLREDQYALLWKAQYLLSEKRGLRLIGSVAVDVGEFNGNRWGGRVGVKWNGSISVD